MEIPVNDNPYDFEEKVDEAIKAVLADPRFMQKNGTSDRLCMNHREADKSLGEVWILNDVAHEVARRFKAKGYFARFGTATTGRHHSLYISKYPTNKDI